MYKRNLKIAAPIGNSPEEVDFLRSAGADELYCGYITPALAKRWPVEFITLNRRGKGNSLEDYKLFAKTAKRARFYHMPLFITVNGLYTPEQYPYLFELVEQIQNTQGVEGIIVADIGFFLELRKRGFQKEVHISTGGTCFNSATAEFFAGLGAKRIVLDRQLTGKEIANLVSEASAGVDFEIFVQKEPCRFIDGFCTFFHMEERAVAYMRNGQKNVSLYGARQHSNACTELLTNKVETSRYNLKGEKLRISKASCENTKGLFEQAYGCGLCSLYDISGTRARFLKIVGRGGNVVNNCNAVRIVAEARSFLEIPGLSRAVYMDKCKKLFAGQIRKSGCNKYDCYFSDYWLKTRI